MQKRFAGVMLLLMVLMGLYLIFQIISLLSWKMYLWIYSSYVLGLLFPYPKLNSIFIFFVVVFCLLAIVAVCIIVKLRKHIRSRELWSLFQFYPVFQLNNYYLWTILFFLQYSTRSRCFRYGWLFWKIWVSKVLEQMLHFLHGLRL